jgi:hypothetical protein
MNFYIRKLISVTLISIFLFFSVISPGKVFSQIESEELIKVNVFKMDTSRQVNFLNLQKEEKTDREKNHRVKEPAAIRSGISVNILLYLMYKIIFRNVE